MTIAGESLDQRENRWGGGKPFGKVKNDWETPPDIFKRLVMEFGGFDLDPAANSSNKMCNRYFDKSDDGLKKPWWGRIYLNPPYSECGKWTAKALKEIKRGATTLVVALLPVDTSTKAFHDHILGKAEIRFLSKRLKYYYLGKPGPHAARFPSMIVIWRRL